jgi:hypothetical protein
MSGGARARRGRVESIVDALPGQNYMDVAVPVAQARIICALARSCLDDELVTLPTVSELRAIVRRFERADAMPLFLGMYRRRGKEWSR